MKTMNKMNITDIALLSTELGKYNNRFLTYKIYMFYPRIVLKKKTPTGKKKIKILTRPIIYSNIEKKDIKILTRPLIYSNN